MIYLLSFIVVIGLPVFLHELGHFLAARSVGIKVEKFYIGFNLFGLGLKKKIKETEYGIGLFPLGGYVKVAGILDESMNENYNGEDYEFRSKNVFQKVWFLSAGVLMNFILSSFIFGLFTFSNGIPEIINEPIINEVAVSLGDEESKEIIPAINMMKQKGININGPISGDIIFRHAVLGKYDLVIAQYHDQGHIPVKLLYFDQSVNITLGVPFIRTSVDHGTAFDIAYKNKANPVNMLIAIIYAIKMSNNT